MRRHWGELGHSQGSSLWKPRGRGALSKHVLGTVEAQIYGGSVLPTVTDAVAVVIVGIAAVTAANHTIPIAIDDVVIVIVAVVAADRAVIVIVKVIVFNIAAGV